MSRTKSVPGVDALDAAVTTEEAGILSFPASLAQQAFWFLDQLNPGCSALNVAVRFHLAGALDIGILEAAINEMIRRHEILRTYLELDDGELMQVVLPSLTIKIDVTDLSGLSGSKRRAELERQGSLEAHRPFCLGEAPLLRVCLLRLGPVEHMLEVTVHHAIADGWSIGLMTEEVSLIYAAMAEDEPYQLPDLPIQFPDYTLWQREYLEGPEIAAQLKYWKKQLAGCVEPNLPTDRPRPQVKGWEGEIVSILLPEDLTKELQCIGQANGATLFMVFLAAFKILLVRYTGQTDIAIGSPVVGRTRSEIEKLIGVFINTLILRTDLSGNPPFTRSLQLVRDTVIDGMANQDLPFEMVVKELHPDRDLGKNPLFQINFIHQRDFVKPVTFGGIALTAVPSRSPGAIFDMQFFMVERDGVWRASCDYNSDLFDSETAVRMLGHFQQLLRSVAANPDTPIGALEILPPEERRRMQIDWNDTRVPASGRETTPELFEGQARRNPRKVAVRCGRDSMTYGELNHAADNVAASLRMAGARPGVLVGLFCDRSLEMVVGVMGILKSGAAYVPMDPTFPAERLAYMVEDADLPVIVTQSALIQKLPTHRARVILLDQIQNLGIGEVESTASGPDDLAYVIFTSGSTGRPKGVQIQHRALTNFLRSMRREPGMTAEDSLFAVTTLSFDIAGLELFLPLTTGATVIVATREISADAQRLAAEIERTGATVMQATPVTWRMLLDSGWKGCPDLKCLIGGEAVPRDLVDRLLPLCSSLWNMYGPTETTIWSTVARLGADTGPVRIGRPIDNTVAYVVSPEMMLQPVGIPGELLIGGDGLALGYLNRDDLTAEKFIADPFSGREGARLFRTGDLARWHADGTLECLQRMDHQVKIRGYRIELGEVEAVLSRHPAVRQSVVDVREDNPGEKQLVGYVIPAEERMPESSQLREYLRSALPDYMVPTAIVPLVTLPLTPNGKIDRNRLPAPAAIQVARGSSDVVSARNSTEQRIASIFAKVLRTDVPSVHDSFFDLGGHSLLAVKLMDGIHREFGKRLPLALLFNSPSVARMAEHLTANDAGNNVWNSLVPIRPSIGKPALFLIHGAGGNVLLYRELADSVGPEISVYGFQSQGLDGETAPLTTIEEMAEHYVRELRAFQPEGPYHLAGYCVGGTIAFEMARILQNDGAKIGLVALIDTYNMGSVTRNRSLRAKLSTLRQRLAFHLSNIRQLESSELRSYLREKLRMAREAMDDMMAPAWRRLRFVRGIGNGARNALAVIYDLNHKAGWKYVPKPISSKVLVFRPRRNYDYFPDPHLGWSEVLGENLDILEIPANPHAMLMRPYVKRVASEICARIANPIPPRTSRQTQ